MDNEKKKKAKLEVTTVAEAKEQLASKADGDVVVWGTKVQEGSKKDFESALSALDDGDVVVWGT